MRIQQFSLIASTLLLSWLWMQAVHEFGHVLAAWSSGGHVAAVILHPLALSRTDLTVNPSPRFVTWCGPVFGSVAPMLIWIPANWKQVRGHALLQFFAAFCLVANGAYLGSTIWEPVGDAADLIRDGTPVWQLALFGVVTLLTGFRLWNGLGPTFGLGHAHGNVDRGATYVCLALLTITLLLELTLSAR